MKKKKSGQGTSTDAFAGIQDKIGFLRGECYRQIKRAGKVGMTCDEVEVETNMLHQTAGPRIKELRDRGLIEDSGKKRPTRSGAKAIVWVAKSDKS